MRRWQVDPMKFDGWKFARKYNLSNGSDGRPADFRGDYENGKFYVVLGDGVFIKDDPPVFEPPDNPKSIAAKY